MNLRLWLWTLITGSKFKAYRMEGDALLKAGRFHEAIEVYRIVQQAWPDQPESYEGMSRVYEGMGLKYEAKRETTIANSLRVLEENPNELKPRTDLIEAFLEKRMYSWAAGHSLYAVKLAPQNVEVLRLAARSYRNNKNYKRAVEVLRTAVKLEPLDADLYSLLTAALQYAGLLQEAMKVNSMAEALKKYYQDPTDPDMVGQAVRQFVGSGMPNLAQELVERSIQGGGDKAQINVIKGGMLLDQGAVPEAMAALHRATKQDPTYAEAYRLLSRGYTFLGKKEKADHHLRMAEILERAKQGGDPLETETVVIKGLLEVEQVPEARARAEAMAKENPGHWRSLWCLGMVARYEDRFKEAYNLFQKARSKNSSSAQLLLDYAWLLSDMGEVTEAVGEARTAVKLAPRNPEVRLNLAAILKRHNFMDQAIEEEDLAEALTKAAKKTKNNRGE